MTTLIYELCNHICDTKETTDALRAGINNDRERIAELIEKVSDSDQRLSQRDTELLKQDAHSLELHTQIKNLTKQLQDLTNSFNSRGEELTHYDNHIRQLRSQTTCTNIPELIKAYNICKKQLIFKNAFTK